MRAAIRFTIVRTMPVFRGYLKGYVSPGGSVSRAVIVRHEDIVDHPEDVVNDLAALGLPRN